MTKRKLKKEFDRLRIDYDILQSKHDDVIRAYADIVDSVYKFGKFQDDILDFHKKHYGNLYTSVGTLETVSGGFISDGTAYINEADDSI